MSANRSEIKSVLRILKSVMKERNIHYTDIADALDLSLPSVKRLMTDDDVSLSRLLSICERLEISFFDLVERVRTESTSSFRFTADQEEFLGDHPDCLAFLFELMTGKTAEDIRVKHQLSKRSLNWYLKTLDELKLIERLPLNKLKVLVQAKNFVWDDHGPIGKRYTRHFIEEMTGHTLEKLEKQGEQKLFIGTRNFSKKNYADFTQELEALVTRYRAVSSMNKTSFSRESSNRIASFMIVTDFWEDSFFSRIREV